MAMWRWMLCWLMVLGCLLLGAEAWAQAPWASLSRTTMSEGETVTLEIEVAEQMQGSGPDLQPLEADFHVLGQSRSTQLRLVNGRQSASTKWIIELEPKRRGELRIPALWVGGEATSPLTLKVVRQQSLGAGGQAQDFFLEVEVEPKNPYVQAQVRYTVRLFYAVALLEGNLDAPVAKDVVSEQIGDDVSYTSIRHGRRYQVFERRYAVFPEKSGEVIIPAMTFQGRAASNTHGRSLSERLFNRGRRLRLKGDDVVLAVRPRPEGYRGTQWLPAEALTLREEWPAESPVFRPGEPVTRTLIVEAKGLRANQLPELELPAIPQLRVYPDQPKAHTRAGESGLVGRLEQPAAIIPNQAGELTLPEIRLPWWDTRAETQRVAVLPARTITVQAASGAPDRARPQPVPESDPDANLSQATVPAKPETSGLSKPGYWPWISTTLLGLWVLTLAAWWRQHRQGIASPGRDLEAPTLGKARRELRRACQANDSHRAARALLNWGAAVWPDAPPRSLGAVAQRLSGDTAPIRELDRVLYSGQGSDWQGGAALQDCVSRVSTNDRRKGRRQSGGLPPLYPQRV